VQSDELMQLAVDALEDLKARDIKVLDVGKVTDITDYMIIASGTSDRHVKSIADNLVTAAKAAGHPPFGVEGTDGGQWVLVDLQDVVVHIMQPKVREFYKLENLWDLDGGLAGSEAGGA
jgi:ribosome-associated protein